METYRIAEILIALKGDFGQYYQKRMEKYKAAGEKPEMVFEAFRECESIPMPEGEVIANINQRYWLKKKRWRFGKHGPDSVVFRPDIESNGSGQHMGEYSPLDL